MIYFQVIASAPSAAVPFRSGTKLHYGGPKRYLAVRAALRFRSAACPPIYRYHHSQGEYENGDVLNFGDVGEISGTCGSSKTAPWSP